MSLAAKLEAAKQESKNNNKKHLIFAKWTDLTPGTKFDIERVKYHHNFKTPSLNCIMKRVNDNVLYCIFLPLYFQQVIPENQMQSYNSKKMNKIRILFKGMDGNSPDLGFEDVIEQI